jgi:quercetin dioxygenase-like cupin family protein
MSTQQSTKATQERHHQKQRLPNGNVFEFMVSPADTGAEICLIRVTIPPGAAAPLHSHSDVELFYVLEGSLEAFQSRDGTPRWTTVGPGDVVSIPGNIKHAVRNSSPFPATLVCVTTSKLYEFFHEVTKPFDPDQPATQPTPDEIQELVTATARYGYWMGSPEENRAIGLSIG